MWVEGFDQVGQILFNFYKQFLGQTVGPRSTIDLLIISQGSYLTLEQQVTLCKPFIASDTRHAMSSIPNFKSPGLDRYNSGFFKATWHKIGTLVYEAVHEFFEIGIMPHYISDTNLILLSKVPSPQQASAFRLISCCNVVYKYISKLLC